MITIRKRLADTGFGALALIVFAFSAFPVYWMVSTSFLPNNRIRGEDLAFFPTPDVFTLDNYRSAMFGETRAPFPPAVLNSISVTFLTLVIALVVGFVASLALTRFQFKGRRTFIVLILVVQMIPGEAMIVSMFRIIDGWQLLNTIIGLTLVYTAGVLPFTIWTLRGFVNGVPKELEEAAMIDGCSRAGAFWRVTFPLLAPGLVATGVFAFIQAWNEFVTALVIMQRPEAMTLPLWLRTFVQATQATNWGAVMAASVLIAIPAVIFFLIVQGRMTGGLVSGAVKG
ncbi:carbohydrate ABC transporter permease [Promicromonospora thailandica]|uniref:N,N'-diacetylchitobiose transport system permease protein n=1 Tax=Promicromonospora thailandica TaxID=765201 RepID=A0A9X2G045_9MICO|nr:carbohydrate ABC transporter permease [Promicromonospora thailandica]MCP2262933.1 N,N'-diacetylchitobiose transport system permease protein [Promicromonospora thailandica]BFF18285.1 ABC transporter permease subunit [Promicromonospora thailandica]